MEHSTSPEQCWQTFKFGTWNVRGLAEKKIEVVTEIERENQDVVVLTETKLKGNGAEKIGNYIHFYSGTQDVNAWAGVSILIKKEFANHNIRWYAINERIIKLRFNVCKFTVVVIGAYWDEKPPSKSKKKESERMEKENLFLSDLKTALSNLKDTEELIILGDFNAWTGTKENNDIVGKFGENEMNTKGRRLIELCSEFHLKIQNSFFEHKDMHKFTFYKPHNSSKSVIDYCITRQTSTFKVKDVIACRWLECGTDHIYLESTISFPFKALQNLECVSERNTEEILDFKTHLLYSKTLRSSYKKYLEYRLDMSKERTTDEMYQHLKERVHSAAKRVLGFEEEDTFDEFLWDQELKELKYKEKRKTDRNFIADKKLNEDRIKNEVWEGICDAIDRKQRWEKNKAVWNNLGELQKRIYGTATEADIDSILAYFKKRYSENRPKFSDNDDNEKECDKLLKDTFIPIDINDIIMALDNLDESQYTAPGNLKLNLIKHSSSTTKRLLRNLIQDIFNGENIPAEISETYIYILPNNYQSIKRNRTKWVSESTKQVLHPIMSIMGTILKMRLEKDAMCQSSCIFQDSPLHIKFSLRLIFQKHFAIQKEMPHLAILDLTETYADVPLGELFEILRTKGTDSNIIKILKRFFRSSMARIVVLGKCLEGFRITKGLKHGCSLTSTLYKMYIEDHIKAWKDDVYHQGIRIGIRSLCFFFSAGKLVLISNKKENLEIMIGKLKDRFRTIGLTINSELVKYLGNGNLKISRKELVGSSTVDYEGAILQLDGRNEEEICKRVLEAKNSIGLLIPVARSITITKSTKKRIFYSIIKNILMYGCETWTLLANWKRRDWEDYIDDVELRYWKWCCERYPDKLTKQEIYESMNIYHDVYTLIMLRKTAWYTEVKEMSSDKWPKAVLEWEPEGLKKHGRPRKKWVDGVEDFMKDVHTFQITGAVSKLFIDS